MRWNAHKKAEIVKLVEDGIEDLTLVCKQHNISMEEFNTWKHRLNKYGKNGLRTTKLKRYRE